MERKFWAARKSKKLGPFTTREQAEQAGLALFPKRPVYRDAFMVGYGEFGPSFDIRFTEGKR